MSEKRASLPFDSLGAYSHRSRRASVILAIVFVVSLLSTSRTMRTISFFASSQRKSDSSLVQLVQYLANASSSEEEREILQLYLELTTSSKTNNSVDLTLKNGQVNRTSHNNNNNKQYNHSTEDTHISKDSINFSMIGSLVPRVVQKEQTTMEFNISNTTTIKQLENTSIASFAKQIMVDNMTDSEKTDSINTTEADTLTPMPGQGQHIEPSTNGNNTTARPQDRNETITAVNMGDFPKNKTSYMDFYLGARFPNGSLGYIADPEALARGRLQYLKQQHVSDKDSAEVYWKVLNEYQAHTRYGTWSEDALLTSDHTCSIRPGGGYEGEGGYKLLVEKIRVHGNDSFHGDSTTRSPAGQHVPQSRGVRILCAVYTFPKARDAFRAEALSWGYKCDGFLAFSTETIAELGLVDLLHEGPESYGNMWQKVRSIWIYIYHHYGRDYDFFHLGGDDLYMIDENLRTFLQTVSETRNNTVPIFLGQWLQFFTDVSFAGGAPGYTLNQKALELFVEKSIPTCCVTKEINSEDRHISICLMKHGVTVQDTRDFITGEQQYHGHTPDLIFLEYDRGNKTRDFYSNLMRYWGQFPHPQNSSVRVGPKYGLDAAATHSASFHYVKHPLFVARLQAILYRQTCPADSALGRGVRAHVRE